MFSQAFGAYAVYTAHVNQFSLPLDFAPLAILRAFYVKSPRCDRRWYTILLEVRLGFAKSDLVPKFPTTC